MVISMNEAPTIKPFCLQCHHHQIGGGCDCEGHPWACEECMKWKGDMEMLYLYGCDKCTWGCGCNTCPSREAVLNKIP